MLRLTRTLLSRAASSHRGVVVKFSPDRGFGFIAPEEGGPDVFVHKRDVQTPATFVATDRVYTKLYEGQCVEYELRPDPSKPRHRSVRACGGVLRAAFALSSYTTGTHGVSSRYILTFAMASATTSGTNGFSWLPSEAWHRVRRTLVE
eukprot:UN3393